MKVKEGRFGTEGQSLKHFLTWIRNGDDPALEVSPRSLLDLDGSHLGSENGSLLGQLLLHFEPRVKGEMQNVVVFFEKLGQWPKGLE